MQTKTFCRLLIGLQTKTEMKTKRIAHIDRLLLFYFDKHKQADLSDKTFIKAMHDDYGFCDNQLSQSLTNLIELGYIAYKKGHYVLVQNIAINDKKKMFKEVVYPWTSTDFINAWTTYVMYREHEHKKPIRTKFAQQLILNKLYNIVDGNEDLAVDVIIETMENRWLGFEHGLDKMMKNAKQRAQNDPSAGSAEILDRAADYFKDL